MSHSLLGSVYGTSVHEAGHVVMATLLNVEFDSVTVLQSEHLRGQVTNMRMCSEHNDVHFILLAVAGYCAEEIKFGCHDEHGASADRQDALRRYLTLHRDDITLEAGDVLGQFEICAKNILCANLTSLDLLVTKLLQIRTMASTDVYELIERHLIRELDCISQIEFRFLRTS